MVMICMTIRNLIDRRGDYFSAFENQQESQDSNEGPLVQLNSQKVNFFLWHSMRHFMRKQAWVFFLFKKNVVVYKLP